MNCSVAKGRTSRIRVVAEQLLIVGCPGTYNKTSFGVKRKLEWESATTETRLELRFHLLISRFWVRLPGGSPRMNKPVVAESARGRGGSDCFHLWRTSLETRLANSGRIEGPLRDAIRPEDRADIREFLNHVQAKGRSPRTEVCTSWSKRPAARSASTSGLPTFR